MSTAANDPGTLDEQSSRPSRIRVQYFYNAHHTIDDVLSPIPAASVSVAGQANLTPRPFSRLDNRMLESSWIDPKKTSRAVPGQAITARSLAASTSDSLSLPPKSHGVIDPSISREKSVGRRPGQAFIDARRDRSIDGTQGSQGREAHPESAGRYPAEGSSTPDSKARMNDGRSVAETAIEGSLDELNNANESDGSFDIGDNVPQGTTGTPFVRVPPRSKLHRAWDEPDPNTLDSRRSSVTSQAVHVTRAEASEASQEPQSLKIPVGASQLHQVSLPELQLEPIYWSPVHDIASCVRATWFYKETMLPVEVDVANLLEAGYVKLRAWTQTWSDELSSAVRAGAEGEEKIAYRLWPKAHGKEDSSRPSTAASAVNKEALGIKTDQSEESLSEACKMIEESVAGLSYDNRAVGPALQGSDGQIKTYKQSVVIFMDQREARILRPSLQPSAYYGRRPLANFIRKGRNIGIAVVRGFDQAAWDRLNPAQNQSNTPPRPDENLLGGEGIPQGRLERQNITDLILVIHGIGQKLSERVESYNFTHAINGFRREFNVEINDAAVRPHLRKDMGIMVLPVNWRSTLTLEEAAFKDGTADPSVNEYTLKDITPESLPHIRGIMISAVIREANRIYGLWCKNHPNFNQQGRVHLIAHSLGSVMALDILSRQPSNVQNGPERPQSGHAEHFDFNTSNLYLCGSPAGFFLLLKQASLLPRKCHERTAADANDVAIEVGGEEGQYGCLAVENIYNVVNPYDPVAYRLNAAVDAAYAASLKTALVPSTAGPWLSFRSKGSSGYQPSGQPMYGSRPNLTERLPSTVELETHNFTREEIAEKRAYLLNDNGQIDYFLRYGGGPLDIQYLSMLGAHSSYWLSRDFIRFLVIETGRQPGRDGAIPNLKARKKK